jgi:hydroxyacylglutathione hydrolase
MPLLVVHTHGHGDHVAGDEGLMALNDPKIPLTLIPATVDAASRVFHIPSWRESNGSVDLGARVVDVIPLPGHSDTSVAYYDRRTGILFTGDSLYPGRLYIKDFPEFETSTWRLVRFSAHQPISHILGNHIEQTRTPFVDYPTGTMYQPEEHELALSRGSLLELSDALTALQGKQRRMRLRDFTLWPKATGEAERAAEDKDYQEVNGRQRKRMWDQSAPE